MSVQYSAHTPLYVSIRLIDRFGSRGHQASARVARMPNGCSPQALAASWC